MAMICFINCDFMLIRILALFILLSLCGCQSGSCSRQPASQWMEPNGKIKTLSTTAMISDIVQQIGGDYVDNRTLICGEIDPHSYQLVKGDDEKFAFADLIFYNGLGLEHGPSLYQQLHSSAKSIALGDRIQQNYPEAILFFQGQVDPHIWMDISLWAKTVPIIIETLSAKDPNHADIYKANGAKLLGEMETAHEHVRDVLMDVSDDKRYLITSHDAFNYFTKAYLATPDEQRQNSWQKRFAAPEGLAPDSQLSTTDIQNIIDHLKTYHVHVLFPESNVSRDSIKKILLAGKEKGLNLHISDKTLYADAMGSPTSDGATYLKMIEHNAKTIAAELKNHK